VLVVHPALPVRSVRELIAHAAANPGKLNYGSSGNGTTAHLCGALFGTRTKVAVVHVPYRGGAQAITDLLRGEIAFFCYQYVTLLPHIAEGTVRAIAVTGAARIPALPDLPTMAEAGVADFEVSAWLALYGPARLPPELAARVNGLVAEIMGTPAVREALIAQGIDPVTGSPEQLVALNKSEITRWARVIAETGARID
jgi:tripartite-type tricarboxylate transporter receptor subunit TctC